MRANELMIGDLARVNRDGLCIKKNTIVEIRGVDGDNKFEGLVGCASCMPTDKWQLFGGIWCDYLEPIPLTQDILEKNGFGNEMSEYLDGDEIEIELNLDDWELENEYGFLACCYQKPITYVHELQHALRLCGIEKEIVL